MKLVRLLYYLQENWLKKQLKMRKSSHSLNKFNTNLPLDVKLGWKSVSLDSWNVNEKVIVYCSRNESPFLYTLFVCISESEKFEYSLGILGISQGHEIITHLALVEWLLSNIVKCSHQSNCPILSCICTWIALANFPSSSVSIQFECNCSMFKNTNISFSLQSQGQPIRIDPSHDDDLNKILI